MRKNSPEIQDKAMRNEFLIGTVRGNHEGPTVIFVGGIHGNEPSGVQALELVMKELEGEAESLRGTVFALRGNPAALALQERFIDEDLNRLWTIPRVNAIKSGELKPASSEENQQQQLCRLIDEILENESGPFYFFDLHTTSCQTIPFLTVNDMHMNRVYAEQYPVPMILGIEEYLEGPVLSYINELGYVAFGFEAGQHDDPHSVQNQLAFIRLTLSFTGALDRSDLSFQHYYESLKKAASGVNEVYEIFFRYEIDKDELFEMQPGFVNFESVKKDSSLASSNGEILKASRDSSLFMPLYQKQGNDGYFLIRKIPRFILRISDWLRRIRMDHIFPLLPGIRWEDEGKNALVVNKRVARFFAREIFHLFGYRNKVIDQDHIRMKNRETVARKEEYKSAPWFDKL